LKFRGALYDRPPFEAEAVADRCAQMRLVEVARGSRGSIDRRVMQRREPAIRAAREVRRDDVRVQLWIQGATHPVPVSRGDQSTRMLEPRAALPAAHEHRLVLHEPERSADGFLVALDERPRNPRGGNGEQNADRLRRRERQVERRDLRLTRARAKPHLRPSSSAVNWAALTCPPRPSSLAPAPSHSPAASPRPL